MATARSATSPTTGADRYRITVWPAAMRRMLRWRRKVRTNNSPSSREIPSRVNRRDRVSPGASASWCTAMPSMLMSGSRANVSVEASAEAQKTAAAKRTWMRMPNPGWKATTRAHGASPDRTPELSSKAPIDHANTWRLCQRSQMPPDVRAGVRTNAKAQVCRSTRTETRENGQHPCIRRIRLLVIHEMPPHRQVRRSGPRNWLRAPRSIRTAGRDRAVPRGPTSAHG